MHQYLVFGELHLVLGYCALQIYILYVEEFWEENS